MRPPTGTRTRYLLDSDPVAVQATMRSVDDAFADVPDEHVAYTLEFEDGPLASCTGSQNAQESTSLRITGTEGQVILEPAFTMASQLRLRRGDTTAALETPETNQMRAVFEIFADRLLTDTDDSPDGTDGLVDMHTMKAIYDAAESGQRTPVETDP